MNGGLAKLIRYAILMSNCNPKFSKYENEPILTSETAPIQTTI